MSLELDRVKEEFRRAYKEYTLKSKGTWTQDDSDELERQIREIENHSNLIACIIGFIIYAIFVYAIYICGKIGGIF